MLFIATPLYENKVSVQYMHGMLQTINLLQSHGLPVLYAMEKGTYIGINREKLVRRFLETDCKMFLFIDADTAFNAQDVLALMSADVDVVSGFYRYRVPVQEGTPTHCFRDLEGNPIDTEAELQECAFLPSGMLMIRRSVFERLYLEYEYLFDQGFRDTSWAQQYMKGISEDDKVMSDFEGEDIYFSRIWRESGGKLHVKADVKLGHIGEYEYKV